MSAMSFDSSPRSARYRVSSPAPCLRFRFFPNWLSSSNCRIDSAISTLSFFEISRHNFSVINLFILLCPFQHLSDSGRRDVNSLAYFTLSYPRSGQFERKQRLKQFDYGVEPFFNNVIMFFWHKLFLRLFKVFDDAADTVNIYTDNFSNLQLTDPSKAELYDHQVAQNILYGLFFFLWHNYSFCFRFFLIPTSSLLT